jgi:hypothetical protein
MVSLCPYYHTGKDRGQNSRRDLPGLPSPTDSARPSERVYEWCDHRDSLLF